MELLTQEGIFTARSIFCVPSEGTISHWWIRNPYALIKNFSFFHSKREKCIRNHEVGRNMEVHQMDQRSRQHGADRENCINEECMCWTGRLPMSKSPAFLLEKKKKKKKWDRSNSESSASFWMKACWRRDRVWWQEVGVGEADEDAVSSGSLECLAGQARVSLLGQWRRLAKCWQTEETLPAFVSPVGQRL